MTLPIALGEVLDGKYKIERILGQGAMGVVVAAVHVQLRQRVAIKFLAAQPSAEIHQRFVREARAAVRLKSEHVARVIDVGEVSEGQPYMVMEFLEGEDLSELLNRVGPLPISEAIEYVLHVCEAMAEAHAAGIIHRDLKPSNLFVTTAVDGRRTIKVLDFGISKEIAPAEDEGDMQLTKTEAVLGSPLYMSIEQMRSSKTVDARADIWSIGAILYQLCTGHVPFEATTFPELIMKVATEQPPHPRSYRPDLPPLFAATILRCLEKDPAARFATVAELAGALERFGTEDAPRSVDRAFRTLGITAERTGPSLPPVSLAPPSAPPPREAPIATDRTLAAAAPAPVAEATEPAWAATAARTKTSRFGTNRIAFVAAAFVTLVVIGFVGRSLLSSPTITTTPAATAVAAPPPVARTDSTALATTAATTPTTSPASSAQPKKADTAAPKPTVAASATAAPTTTAAPTATATTTATATAKPNANKNPLDMEIQ